MLLCPKCLKPLVRIDRTYKCESNHCYDIAKEGYVNLILANQKHSSDPGDNDDSLKCRDSFLNDGYYQPLADKLSEIINRIIKDDDVFLDAGCGTGYYLKHIIERNNKKVNYYATDIAKKGVAMTAKKCKDATCFVGNVFHLPFADETLDFLMSVFTPYSSDEFYRVVKKGGYVLAVNSGRMHLFDLKNIVYDNPYENQETEYVLPGFELVEKCNVNYMMHLKNNEVINNLWKMMPYYHTTSHHDSDKLLKLNEVDSRADFFVCLYKKVT